MAKVNKNQLLDVYASRINSNTAQPTVQTTPSATLLSGGRAASQAAQQLNNTAARVIQQNNSLGTNPTANLLNSNGLGSLANANRDVTDTSRFNAYKGATPADSTPTYDVNVNGGNGGGGGVGTDAVRQVTDPYATIYALYENSINAQRDALNQQRQARLNALQANYNNAKSKLDSSYASGETELNQNADEALRQAYISNMLNQRNMAQYLAGQGITGGAAESILANLYNTYGNNRNDIERGRMDNLRQLLANYQGTLGDIENSYLTGMSDADSDYSGNIADALTNYYNNLASLQQQNIANQYKAALGKSGSSGGGNNETASPLDSDILKGLKNYKDSYANARQYLARNGVPESQMEDYLWEAGLGGLLSSDEAVQEVVSTVPNSVRTNVLNTLRQVASLSRGTDDLEKNIAAQMDQLVKTYGLNQAQATALLKELGF